MLVVHLALWSLSSIVTGEILTTAAASLKIWRCRTLEVSAPSGKPKNTCSNLSVGSSWLKSLDRLLYSAHIPLPRGRFFFGQGPFA